jgi:hypothetical protein
LRRADNRQGIPVGADLDSQGKISQGNILEFRPPKARTIRTRQQRKNEINIVRLLDLSKYEKPRATRRDSPDDYRVRMRENIAALILLGALVGIAATDFTDIEQSQSCPIVLGCRY